MASSRARLKAKALSISVSGALMVLGPVLAFTLLSTFSRSGALIGSLGILGVLSFLGVLILELAGADALLIPLFLLSLAFPLNKTLSWPPITIYTFDLLLAEVYLVWLGRLLTGRAKRPHFSTFDLLALGLIGWLFLSALQGMEVTRSLDGCFYFFRLYLIYLYVANNLRNLQRLRYAITALLILVALQSFTGLAQYVTKSNLGSLADLVGERLEEVREVEVVGGGALFRVRGTLDADTSLAHWMELLLPLLLSLILTSQAGLKRGFLLALLGLGTLTLIFTFTRGAWIGLFVSLGLVGLLGLRRWLANWRNLIYIMAFIIILAGLSLSLSGLIGARLFGTLYDTLQVRVDLNEAALAMVEEYPAFGVGWNNFALRAPEFGVGSTWEEEGKSPKVHNLYLAFASEGGIPALALFLLLLGQAFRVAWKGFQGSHPLVRPLALGVMGGLTGALTHGLVAWGLLSFSVFPLFWVLVGLVEAPCRWPSRGGE